MSYGGPVYPAYVPSTLPPSPSGYAPGDAWHASRMGTTNQPYQEGTAYTAHAGYGGIAQAPAPVTYASAGGSPYQPAGYLPAGGASPYRAPAYLPQAQREREREREPERQNTYVPAGSYGPAGSPYGGGGSSPYGAAASSYTPAGATYISPAGGAPGPSPYRPPTYLPGASSGNSPADPYARTLPPVEPATRTNAYAPPSPRGSYVAPPSPRSGGQGPPNLLHPLVAFNARLSPVDWDMRHNPAHTLRIPSHFQTSELVLAATAPPTTVIRLISPFLPWAVTIEHPATVSVMAIFDSLYSELQKPVTQAEWRIAPEKHREKVTEAYTKRCQMYDNPDYERSLGVKRIDWLVRNTRFAGIRKDDDALGGLQKDNLMPYTFLLMCIPR